MNTIGTLFRLTSAGESHGAALTGIIDGMPAGIAISEERIALEMSRRRPGTVPGTARREDDHVEILSGILDGVTLGTPIAFIIRNNDARPQEYDRLRGTFRPSHADFTYQAKYGIRDIRGGGRASARETAVRVAAGAMALQALETHGITISAYTQQIGPAAMAQPFIQADDEQIYASPVRCPDVAAAAAMSQALEHARAEGDTLGGVVSCVVRGVPAGVGEPVFGKLQAQLAAAMMSIPAAHGFEYGDGFAMAEMAGSQAIDPFTTDPVGRIITTTNHSGGIQGGISNGMPITMRVAFKPIASLMQPVPSVDRRGQTVMVQPGGRHDVCAVPRAVPVVRAMAALTILDALLVSNCASLFVK